VPVDADGKHRGVVEEHGPRACARLLAVGCFFGADLGLVCEHEPQQLAWSTLCLLLRLGIFLKRDTKINNVIVERLRRLGGHGRGIARGGTLEVERETTD